MLAYCINFVCGLITAPSWKVFLAQKVARFAAICIGMSFVGIVKSVFG